MQHFRKWLDKNRPIPQDAIKVPLPQIIQETCYSCGSACLHVVCKYYKVGPETEKEFRKLLKTTYKCGTIPQSIVKVARDLGLNVKFHKTMSMNRLKSYLDKKIPVICTLQAWGRASTYPRDASGHYVVAIGYDNNNFYFEDPSIKDKERGFLNHKDFDERWHDIECDGNRYHHMGIAIWKNRYKKPEAKTRKATKID